jgi:hypothetical protein
MSRADSSPFSITVSDSPLDVPYALPSAGGKRELLVSGATRFLSEVRPAWHTSPGGWKYSLLNAYGGGAFTPELTAAGAYVLAGHGGHGAPMVQGFVHFDFTTGLWAPYVHAADKDGTPAPERVTPDYAPEELIDDPTVGRANRELLGFVELPLPDHTYQLLHVPPRAHAGGTLHLVRTLSTAVTQAAYGGSRAHKIALEGSRAGRWSRASTNRLHDLYHPGTTTEAESAYDPTDRRIYLPTGFPDYWNVAYIDLLDETWKSFPVRSAAEAGIAGGPRSIFVDDERRLLVAITLTHIGFLDLTETTDRAWRLAPVSGAFPNGDGTGVNWRGRMDKYPSTHGGDDCWYFLWGRGVRTNGSDGAIKEKAHQQYLWRLEIPSDPVGGTWSWSTVAPTAEDDSGGITAAHEQDFANAGGMHYTRFFYVPALRCFAWIPRHDSPVELIKP